MLECEGCYKQRHDVRAMGRDANGDADSPCLCFLCRKEAEKGRRWNHKTARYEYPSHECYTEEGA